MNRAYVHSWPPADVVEVMHSDLVEVGIGAAQAAIPGPSPAGNPVVHLRAASTAAHFRDMPWHATLTATQAERLGRALIAQANALREIQHRTEIARTQVPLWQ